MRWHLVWAERKGQGVANSGTGATLVPPAATRPNEVGLAPPMTELPLNPTSSREQFFYLMESFIDFARMRERAQDLVRFGYAAERAGVTAEVTAFELETAKKGVDFMRDAMERFPALDLQSAEKSAQRGAHRTLMNARVAMAVAVLVLAHSAFDEYLSRLLRLAAVANRAGVLERLSKRSVPLGALRERTAEDLETEAIEAWLLERDRDPMLKKWELVQLFTPLPERLRAHVRYDRGWLVKFDEARHDAAHKECELAAAFDLEGLLLNLYDFAKWLLWQHNLAYGLALSPAIEQGLAEGGSQSRGS